MQLLERRAAQLVGALHLKKGMVEFSDGWRLYPRFNQEPDMMWDRSPLMANPIPIDDLHLDAIALYGRAQLQPTPDAARDNVINVGEKEDDPVTVRELLAAINGWCLRPLGATTNFLEYIDADGAPLVIGIEWVGYNLDASRDVFEMSFVH